MVDGVEFIEMLRPAQILVGERKYQFVEVDPLSTFIPFVLRISSRFVVHEMHFNIIERAYRIVVLMGCADFLSVGVAGGGVEHHGNTEVILEVFYKLQVARGQKQKVGRWRVVP